MIKGYKCDFCDFFSTSYNEIVDHEFNCFYNKKNKRCFTCSHYSNLGEEIGEVYWVCERTEEHDIINIPYDTAFLGIGCILWEENKINKTVDSI